MKPSQKTVRKIVHLLWKDLLRQHKQHYQSPLPFTLGVLWGKGRFRPAVYDPDCVLCVHLKDAEDEFLKEWLPK